MNDSAAALNLWLGHLQLTEFSPTHPMSSYVVDNTCGTSSSQEFGCANLERRQNISVNCLSPMAKLCSLLPAWHAAVKLVGTQNKRRGGGLLITIWWLFSFDLLQWKPPVCWSAIWEKENLLMCTYVYFLSSQAAHCYNSQEWWWLKLWLPKSS